MVVEVHMNEILVVVPVSGVDAGSTHDAAVGEENVVIGAENAFPGLDDFAVHVDEDGSLSRVDGAAGKKRVTVPAFVGVIAQHAGKIDGLGHDVLLVSAEVLLAKFRNVREKNFS